ncbi:hypothetical protein TpMuguga_01g00562 [Theileria parva strain Muguga]|uniref:Uncharacterized protein n=1 Tax=Theileria parva TaxID=5875 RepID=Q4N8B0_THEPA|nr:uncharacterized protein TpMuguga_01g00562 [Theileria parva strain Muguga]EAN33798.1 hypothetical protein TpMuguga_01g00562 [Theileria parva strain Muguga]|eukprot:XP_766081.1 hypothetical protein [Theileria parva strain Muguga]
MSANDKNKVNCSTERFAGKSKNAITHPAKSEKTEIILNLAISDTVSRTFNSSNNAIAFDEFISIKNEKLTKMPIKHQIKLFVSNFEPGSSPTLSPGSKSSVYNMV